MEGAPSTTEQEPIPVASQGQKKALFPSRGSSDRDFTKSVPLLVSRERPMGQKTRRGVYMCVCYTPVLCKGLKFRLISSFAPRYWVRGSVVWWLLPLTVVSSFLGLNIVSTLILFI